MSSSNLFDSSHNSITGSVRKEHVSVNIDSEIIHQEVYVDTDTGLDIDPHSGVFRTREETIKITTDIYNIGKVSMKSDLERYNKWIRGEGSDGKKSTRKDIFTPNEEKIALMAQGKRRQHNTFDSLGSGMRVASVASSIVEDNPFVSQHQLRYRRMKSQAIKLKSNQEYFSKGRFREAIFMYKNSLQWLVPVLPAEKFTLCGHNAMRIASYCGSIQECSQEVSSYEAPLQSSSSSILPLSHPLQGSEILTSSELAEVSAQASLLLSNISECLLRLERYAEAFSAATQSVECDEGNRKGLFRAVSSCLKAANEAEIKNEPLSSLRAEAIAALGLRLIEGKRKGMILRDCVGFSREDTPDAPTVERFDWSVLTEEESQSWISLENALRDIVSRCASNESDAITHCAVEPTQDNIPVTQCRAYMNRVGHSSLFPSVFCR